MKELVLYKRSRTDLHPSEKNKKKKENGSEPIFFGRSNIGLVLSGSTMQNWNENQLEVPNSSLMVPGRGEKVKKKKRDPKCNSKIEVEREKKSHKPKSKRKWVQERGNEI